ncbi:MAG: hypothetical protein LBE09_01240, partial [Christensenellaceae bacterium]|nr:hypothetical protein [Christensenellaceae bacterium]
MQGRNPRYFIALFILLALLVFTLWGCSDYVSPDADTRIDTSSPANIGQQYPAQSETRKNEVVDRATNSMDALLAHLDSDLTADTGYFMGADITINTSDTNPAERSAFVLKLRANLYTYPYEIKDENGNVILGDDGLPLTDPIALARHNELIKYNDIVLEWFDAMSNQMLIGFYFDGINPNSADTGNHLYLNLLGSKRIFLDFGDSVLYQQIVRLITHFDLNTLVQGSGNEDDPEYVSMFNTLMKTAITDNYKEVLNGDVTSLFFNQVDLSALRSTLTEEIQGFFAPFKDRFDPLTNKYLGFKFSTLGSTVFETIVSDMQFLVSKPLKDQDEMLTELVLDAYGSAEISKSGTVRESVPFTTRIDINYSLRISTDIVIDKTDYVVYEYGAYEFVGDLWVPAMQLEMDALIRTDVNEYDPDKNLTNATNRVWAEFYDQSNQNVLIGMYYKDEKVYLNIKELMDMYGGGIQLQDLGFPLVYREGIDLASLLSMLFDIIDEYIVMMVDGLLKPSDPESEDSFAIITDAITDNMVSTMKDPLVPSSRNTMKIKVDVNLIRIILREVYGTTYTNELIINLLRELIGVDLYETALILGIDVNVLLETLYIDVTYDVDEYTIKIEVKMYEDVEQAATEGEEGNLVLRLNLTPTHIGETVVISFPQFENYKPLQQIQTYSATIEGQIIFAKKDSVDLSDIFGAAIGDLSGKNTQYILPNEAGIYFTLVYDLYIRDQILANGRWTRAGRSAISVQIYIYDPLGGRVDLARVYANDVVFDSAAPTDEFGYMWIELVCIEGMPKMKVREDLFLESLYQILGGEANDAEGVIVSPTTIIQALMEDSWPVFEPEVIRLTTSNQMFKNLFGVDELIADITLQVGFKQRVYNIDELENEFAMYTVGELTDISGETIYDVKLHETISVMFDFGTYVEYKDFILDYDEKSISVPVSDFSYYPATKGQFMGAMRSYFVLVSNTSQILELVVGHLDEEPIDGSFDSEIRAYIGQGVERTYKTVDYNFYAYYDRTLRYYVMSSDDWGYNVIFDAANKTYIIDLGTNVRYDEAIRRLSEYNAAMYPLVFADAKAILGRLMPSDTTQDVLDAIDPAAIYAAAEYSIFPRVFTDKSSNEYTYILDSTLKGYYIVATQLPSNPFVIYDSLKDIYIAESDEIASLIATVIPNREYENPDDITQPISVPPTIIPLKTTFTTTVALEVIWNLLEGYYVIEKINDAAIDFSVVYDASGLYYVKDSADQAKATDKGLTTIILASLNWDNIKESQTLWNGIEKNQKEYFKKFVFYVPNWDTMTIEGGLFYVEVIIGNGMMATYKELITMRVLNRQVDTNKYISANIYNEDSQTADMSVKIRVPVIDTIEIDPYVYIIAKGDYLNNVRAYSLDGGPVFGEWGLDDPGFVTWYFSKFEINIEFTEIYGNANDTTDIENTQFYTWDFEYQDGDATYSEENISNHNDVIVSTYILMEYQKQIVALEIQILPRVIDYIMFDGETKTDTYTVDALDSATYIIPNYPTIYFKEGGTLNFGALADTQKSSILKGYKFSDQFYDGTMGEKESIKFVVTDDDAVKNYTIADYVITWSNPVADNVFTTGNSHPFLNSTSNTTTAFLDIRSHVAPDPAASYTPQYETGFPDNWYQVPIITVTVLVPDKKVTVIDYTDFKAHNVVFAEGMTAGQFIIDPYMYPWSKLPEQTIINFDTQTDGVYDPKSYPLVWKIVDNQGDIGITITDDGSIEVSAGAVRCEIETSVGDGNNKITLKAYIVILPSTIKAYQLIYGETPLAGDTSTSDSMDPASNDKYIQQVDTFSRFNTPTSVKFYFDDGTYREYKVVSYSIEFADNNAGWSKYPGYWGYRINGDSAKYVLGINIGQGGNLLFDYGSGNSSALYVPYYVVVTDRKADQDSQPVKSITLENWSDSNGGQYQVSLKENGSVLSAELVISGVDFSGYTAENALYNYFIDLLGQIKVELNDATISTLGFENTLIITDALDKYSLYGSEQYYNIVRQFDAELMKTSDGLKFTIYLGQGPGAFDCNVIIKNCTIYDQLTSGKNFDLVDTAQQGILISPYDIVTSEPLYGVDDPFSFDSIVLSVEYENAGTQNIVAPDVWYVDSVDGMALKVGDRLEEINWSVLSQGGVAVFTALLPDGIRVTRKITIVGLVVETFSAEDEYYPIAQYNTDGHIGGIVYVDTIYHIWETIFNLSQEDLPNQITTQDGVTIQVPFWEINETLINEIKALSSDEIAGYQIESNKYQILATSRVLGTDITLYIQLLPSQLSTIEYSVSDNSNRGYITHQTQQTHVVYIDPYFKSDYAGILTMPESVTLNFASGKTFKLDNPVFTTLNGQLNSIPYTYQGVSYDGNAVQTSLALPDGTNVGVLFQFYNNTVDYIIIDNVEIKNNTRLMMDPYATNRDIPLNVVVVFKEKSTNVGDYNYNVSNWNLVNGYPTFELKYDTYQRL